MKTILIVTANDPNDKLQMLAREGKDVQFLENQYTRIELARNYSTLQVSLK